jgi:hypothetical protein
MKARPLLIEALLMDQEPRSYILRFNRPAPGRDLRRSWTLRLHIHIICVQVPLLLARRSRSAQTAAIKLLLPRLVIKHLSLYVCMLSMRARPCALSSSFPHLVHPLSFSVPSPPSTKFHLPPSRKRMSA